MAGTILLSIIALLFTLASFCQAHLYMLQPLSRGGTSSIGGTTDPCGTTADLTGGTTTQLTKSSTATLTLTVAIHGPGPFSLLFAEDGVTFSTVLVPSFYYSADSSNQMNLQYQVPATLCSGCALQVKGMAQSDGTSEWYNCANIAITEPPCSSYCQAPYGTCNSNNVCECRKGYAGNDCTYPVTANGDVVLSITLPVAADEFDKTVFLSTISQQTGLPITDIKIVSIKTLSSSKSTIAVQVEFINGQSITAVNAAQVVQSLVGSNQTIGTYPAQSVTNVSAQQKGGGSSSSAGATAAAVIVVLFVVGAFGGLLWYWKKNPEKRPAKIAEMMG